jgi:hypothetical protein
MTAPQTKTYEQKLANVVRRLASDHDGEVIAAVSALKRLLASRDADLNDFAGAVELLATGGLEQAELERVFEAGRAKGLSEAGCRQAEELAVYGQRLDGSYDWLAIALFCQRETTRLRDGKEREFVDDMASRLSFPGREPTGKQSTWLLAIFRRLGGRMKK